MEDDDRPAASLWSVADLVTPMAVRVAATLRLADHISRGLRTASELAAAAGVDAGALDRLLRHLVTAGILSRHGDGDYALTASGDGLRDDHPSGWRALLDVEGAVGRADLSLVHLLHSVRTGKACFPERYGRGFWEDLASDRARTVSFDTQMGRDVASWAGALVDAYDWGSLGHVIDVGGGNGTLLAALLLAHPILRGTVFDQPATAATARSMLADAGLGKRSEVVSGSFFDALPPGGGGYLLCAVLHDWDDDAARRILRRCAEAAVPAGTVLVVERTGADGASPPTDMDLRVLAYFGGCERGVAELAALAAEVGLGLAAVHPAGDLSIVELTAR